ncbi:MAG TPA: ribosome maturation factor RimM [Cyclobacteriaceae bacterium]|nr:ribosome maturation factor RimM [Cyclobacteriaceae bacterium]
MKLDELYKAGFIMRAHGLKGEVTISLDADAPADWETLESILLEVKSQFVPYFIESISVRHDKAFLKLEDVNTPEAAASLKGTSIYLPKASRPKPARGDFYNEELIDFEVIDEELGLLGTVQAIEQAGPSRFIVLSHKTKEVMIPVNGPFIKSINRTKKTVTVSLPEGFLDI